MCPCVFVCVCVCELHTYVSTIKVSLPGVITQQLNSMVTKRGIPLPDRCRDIFPTYPAKNMCTKYSLTHSYNCVAWHLIPDSLGRCLEQYIDQSIGLCILIHLSLTNLSPSHTHTHTHSHTHTLALARTHTCRGITIHRSWLSRLTRKLSSCQLEETTKTKSTWVRASRYSIRIMHPSCIAERQCL